MGDLISMIAAGFVALLIVLGCFFAVGFLYRNYNVWSQEMAGKAQFAEAEWTRKIAVEEARARQESAGLDAQAEIERAKGVAEANRIVGEGLKGNEEYLRYLWIDKIQSNGQVIYVPTEAGLPILEAGKRP